jgi:hypothetical protein
MKKSIWIAAGVTGMLLGNPSVNAKAAVNLSIGSNHGPSFSISSRPNFVHLQNQGFSVSVNSPYDIIQYGNHYYINQNGVWYRSSDYRGPWIVIRAHNLPSKIRRHRLEDIRGYRDREYRRNEDRRHVEQQRNDDNNRRNLEQQRSDENDKRKLDQRRSDENDKRKLDQRRSDENDKRKLDQQRTDEKNKQILDEQRNNENRNR